MILAPPNKHLQAVATSGGRDYSLNMVGIYLEKITGLGIHDVARLSERSPGQRGDTDTGFVQGARYMDLVWRIYGEDLTDYMALREYLLDVFVPRASNDPVTFTITHPNGRIVAVKGHLEQDLHTVTGKRVRTTDQLAVTVKINDPRLYNPEQKSTNVTPLNNVTGWVFPWTIPWTFGPSQASGSVTINYAVGKRSAAPEYPIIEIHGPIASPVITHGTTGAKIDLNGLTILAGDYITIDLKDGIYSSESPTIRNSGGASVEQYVSADSSLSTFYLVPAGKRISENVYSDGNNNISFYGTGGTAATKMVVRWYERFEGI